MVLSMRVMIVSEKLSFEKGFRVEFFVSDMNE
jgi:hypothetical protein